MEEQSVQQENSNNEQIQSVSQSSFEEKPLTLGKMVLNAPIGIGTWAWGDSSTWGYKGYDSSFNDNTLKEAFMHAVERSVNFWDSAEVYGYGRSETLLGEFIKDYNTQNQNNPKAVKFAVATKFLPVPWRLTQGSLHSALDGSIQRLGRNPELYQVHGPAFSLRKVETWAEALAEDYKKGKIGDVGVSNYNADQVRRTHAALAKHGIPLISNQVEFSLLRNNIMVNGLLDTCKELGVTVIAYSPLGMGRLTGKYNTKNPPPGNRRFGNIDMKDLEVLIEKLKSIGDHHGKTPAQVAVNWCICKGTIPIVGVKNKNQVDENLGD